MDNLIERGLDPEVCRLFIVDGAKALTKAIRTTFGADIPIQRCQVHKARNITDRIDPKLHAWVRHALKQAWKLDDADKAERLPRNLARRFGQEAPDVSRSILEGFDEILTVGGLGLSFELRRSLASTNIIASMNGGIRQVCRNVKCWRDARMALRWTRRRNARSRQGLLKLTSDESKLYEALAKHILLNLNGMTMVRCIQDMVAAGESVNLTTLRKAQFASRVRPCYVFCEIRGMD